MVGPLPLIKNFISDLRIQMLRRSLGHPEQKLRLIAITGSQGKTTVAHLVFAILRRAQYNVGLISTDGVWANEQRLNRAGANTMTGQDLMQTFKSMYTLGIEVVVIECHADVIRDGAFKDIEFDSGALLNIAGGEFIDGYRDQLQYAETVFEPITQIMHEGLAVINGDDDSVQWIEHRAQYIEQNIYAAWCSKEQAEDLRHSLKGMSFRYEGGFFQSPMIGSINLENLLLAIKLTNKYTGIDQIDRTVTNFAGVAGRMEPIQIDPFTVIVDYAYQPVIAERVVQDLNELRNSEARLILVLGAAGKRSKMRRYIAEMLTKYAKVVVLTALDPRGEDVGRINTEIIQHTSQTNTVVVERIADHDEYKATDKVTLRNKVERVVRNGDTALLSFDANSPLGRADGISFALEFAGPDDMVVVFGKGNDEVMDFGRAIYEWNDRKLTSELVASGQAPFKG